MRLKQKGSENPVKNIEISVLDNKTIVIKNDGETIDVDKHPAAEQLRFGLNGSG